MSSTNNTTPDLVRYRDHVFGITLTGIEAVLDAGGLIVEMPANRPTLAAGLKAAILGGAAAAQLDAEEVCGRCMDRFVFEASARLYALLDREVPRAAA